MKINSLLETTASSDPANATSSAPKMGRSDKFLEEKDETVEESTTSGSVASVDAPVGTMQRRGKGSMFAGIKTSSKYPNSKSVKEGFSDDNFTADDINRLATIRDLPTIKAQAKELIKGKPIRRMKPEKIAYFYDKVDSLSSPVKVVKLMYDLLLAGEGLKTVGSSNSMDSNTYQKRFTETEQLAEVDPRNFDSDEDYYAARNAPAKQRSAPSSYPYSQQQDDDYFREIFRKQRLAKQKAEREQDHDRLATGTNEGEEMGTFAALKDWQVWDVMVMNNYYRGKYADYGARYYSVVASSPEEARQVVLNNSDYVLRDLLSRKLQSGKKVLPRGSALPIEDKRVRDAKPGSITTMGFKKMLTPDGVQSFKFTNGKIVDGAHMQGGEVVDEASFDYTTKDLGNDYAGFPSNHGLKHKFLARIKPEKQQLYKDKMNNMHEFDQLFQLFAVAKQRGDIIDQAVQEADPGYDKHSMIGKFRRGREANNKGWGQLGKLFQAGKDEKASHKALRNGNRYYNMTHGGKGSHTPGGFPSTTVPGLGKVKEDGVAEGTDDKEPFDYAKWKASNVKPRKPRGYKDAEAIGQQQREIDKERKERKEQGVAEGSDDYFANKIAQKKAEQAAATAEFRKYGVTARKHGGDDANSWAVFINGRMIVNGLSSREVPYYKKEALKKAKETQGVADEQVNEKSKSQAQFRTMAAVAHNPKFAKKVGISQEVGKEFHSADKKSSYKSLPKKVDEVSQELAVKTLGTRRAYGMDGWGNDEHHEKADRTEKRVLKKFGQSAVDAANKETDKQLYGDYRDVKEGDISEDKLANDLYRDLQIFKKGADKDIGSKAKDKEISNKAKDKDIVAKEGMKDIAKSIKHAFVGDPKDGPRKTMGLHASLEQHADDMMKKVGHKFKGNYSDEEHPIKDDGNEGSSGKWHSKTGRVEEDCWDGYEQIGMKDKGGKKVPNCVPVKEEDVSEDWQKTNKQDKTDGMSPKAVKAYRRENPGSKLKTAVTKKPSELKAGSKDANRRKSFCARMSGNEGPMKDENGKPTPKAKALKRWNC